MSPQSPSTVSASETQPLLKDATQTTYEAVDDSVDLEDHEEESPSLGPATKPVSRADLAWILIGLWSAVFLGALDGTIVATLMTPIGSYFHKSNQASYIGTSFLLSVCCFTPLYGRLCDILGRRGAMLLGLSFFGLGTAMCGLAPSMEALIVARAVAGMGGGGVMTVSSVAVTDLIPLKQRGLYQGLANILFGLGAGIGGPLGGWLNDGFGWRSAFLFQIPILVISFILVAVKVDIPLPAAVQEQSLFDRIKRMDFFGSVTLVGTVGSLLLGFSLKTTEDLPWSCPLIYGLFIASAIFCVLFVLVESRWAPYPVMPLHLIAQRTPLAVSLTNFFGSVIAFSMLYNVPLYFNAVRLSTAANAGSHLLPHSRVEAIADICYPMGIFSEKIALSTGSVFAGWMMRRTGKLYTLTIVSALLSVLANILVTLWNNDTPQWHLWLDIVPQGFGMASLITSTLIAMIAGVTKGDLAVATGITYLFRTTGQVLGVSLSGTVLQAVLLQKLRERITGPNAGEIISSIRHSTEVIPTLDPYNRQAAIDSYADALRVVFICQTALSVVMLICCMPIQENPLPGTHEEQEAQFRRNESNQANDTA